ncbi:MAG: hypothetical protein CMH55_08310 [Myxococcales bacterium]|nr:hypothetical protein [Myxococcales bacterium]
MDWGLTVGILCALSWALLDLQRKALTARHPDPLTLAAVVPLLASAGALMYALLRGAPIGPPPPSLYSLMFWIVVLNIVANFLFLHSLTVGELSKVIPLLSLTPVVGAVGGFFLFGEELSLGFWVGATLIAVGTFLLLFRKGSAGHGGLRRPSTVPGFRWVGMALFTVRALVLQRGVPSMFGVVLLWGWIPAIDKQVITGGEYGLEAYLIWSTALIGLPLLVERLIRKPQALGGILRRSPWLLASLAPAAAAALGTQMESLVHLDVGVAEALKRAGVVVTVLAGAIIFHEPQAFRRMPWILLVVAGACLVALSRTV